MEMADVLRQLQAHLGVYYGWLMPTETDPFVSLPCLDKASYFTFNVGLRSIRRFDHRCQLGFELNGNTSQQFELNQRNVAAVLDAYFPKDRVVAAYRRETDREWLHDEGTMEMKNRVDMMFAVDRALHPIMNALELFRPVNGVSFDVRSDLQSDGKCTHKRVALFQEPFAMDRAKLVDYMLGRIMMAARSKLQSSELMKRVPAVVDGGLVPTGGMEEQLCSRTMDVVGERCGRLDEKLKELIEKVEKALV